MVTYLSSSSSRLVLRFVCGQVRKKKKEGRKEGRKTKRQTRVWCWTLTVACVAGKRLQETRKRRSTESDASKMRAGGAPGVMNTVPMIRSVLPRGRFIIAHAQEILRPNLAHWDWDQ